MAIKLKADRLYKIFGAQPERAFRLLEQGYCKEEIFDKTCLTVGVQDISFDVDEGEIFVIMGLSGSGKSTLVRMLNGLVEPTSGKVFIDDVHVTQANALKLRDIRRDKVSMVFQHFALFPHMTVVQNVAYGLKVKGVGASERRARARAVLEQVGLDSCADLRPGSLSGGMQQRVGLARSLAAQTEILLMDEPFGALDPLIRCDMQQELVTLQRTLKKTIIFITHDLGEALVLGDRIAIMKDGRFVQVGTAEEIVGSPASDYVASFTRDIDRSRVFDVHSVMEKTSETVQLGFDTATTALGRMEALGREALYVKCPVKKEIVGLVTQGGLAASMCENGNDLDAALVTDFPRIKRESRLFELYPLASRGLPVAVEDGAGRFVGMVEPKAIFKQLCANGV